MPLFSDPTSPLFQKILAHVLVAILSGIAGFAREIWGYLSGRVPTLDYMHALLRGGMGIVTGYATGHLAVLVVPMGSEATSAIILAAIIGGWAGGDLMNIIVEKAAHKIRNELNGSYDARRKEGEDI